MRARPAGGRKTPAASPLRLFLLVKALDLSSDWGLEQSNSPQRLLNGEAGGGLAEGGERIQLTCAAGEPRGRGVGGRAGFGVAPSLLLRQPRGCSGWEPGAQESRPLRSGWTLELGGLKLLRRLNGPEAPLQPRGRRSPGRRSPGRPRPAAGPWLSGEGMWRRPEGRGPAKAAPDKPRPPPECYVSLKLSTVGDYSAVKCFGKSEQNPLSYATGPRGRPALGGAERASSRARRSPFSNGVL